MMGNKAMSADPRPTWQDPASEASAILGEAEQRSERVLAWLRLGVLIVLVMLQRVFDLISNEHVFAVSLTIYGVATVGALALAYWLTHRQWLGWALTTLDSLLVLHFAASLVFFEGWSTTDAITAPGVLMVFLVLAQAAVRYRPALVAYAAGLFLSAWVLLHVVTDPSGIGYFQHWRGDEAALMAIVMATALALFAAALRARRLLTRGIAESLLRATLSRFVPSKLIAELERAPGAPFGVLHGRTHNVAVLFIDIRGFTAMAEDLEPAAVLELLNEYRRRVTAPVVRNGGVIDKFIGDAVMAVFGVPRPHASDAGAALRSGVEVLETVAAWNEERRRDGKPPVNVGVGAHYGEAVVGVVGEGQRLEYTVIGDTVNLAQRAERIAARSDSPILITRELLDMAKTTDSAVIAEAGWIELAPQPVEGRRQAASFFALPH
ncbi:MAG: adenylate/guanylate cyclase domain-containing protein [Gammaproteobacteria bacterium]